MIRMIAVSCLAALAACSLVVPATSPGHNDLDVIQRSLEAEQANSGTEVKLTDGFVLPLYSGPASPSGDANGPVLEVCHALGGAIGIEVWTWAEGPNVGPQHPSVQKVKVAPGTCVFASGALVEGRASGFASDEIRAATEWMTARIAELEAEPQSPTRDGLLEHFKKLTSLPPSSRVKFRLAAT